MSELEDRVVVVTGAGRGIGREHALLLASLGARVVVNDLGGSQDGTGTAAGPAEDVVAEIRDQGGQAEASNHDVADEAGAGQIVQTAVERFGRLDAVVNNAGILRDRVLVNLSEQDWDLVVRVNLRGTFLVTQAAARHWRELVKKGERISASVVNTSSESGVFANPGQANYAAAKAAVATLTQVASKELSRYGVRVNAILPQARTRLTEQTFGDALAAKEGTFDRWDPANVSPFVAYLCAPVCPISGEVFLVGGNKVQRVRSWELDEAWKLTTDGRWSFDQLASAVESAGVPQGQAWTADPAVAR